MRTLYLLTLFILVTSCVESPLKNKPNVVLILTDDQGYGDVGYHGNPYIQTPTIDSLAQAGIRFTDFYVSPRCAPTRAALMTGRHPEKTGVFHVTDGGYIMAPEEVTMAEYFKHAGYATAIFGKWHVGDHYPHLPEDQGFDDALIHKGGAIGQIADHPDNYWDMTRPLAQRRQCYFNTTLFKNREVFKAKGYIADVLTDHAIKFIEAHREEPFFVYLPYNTPHDPYQVPDKYLDRYKDLPDDTLLDKNNGTAYRLSDHAAARYVYAMMTNLDDNIKRIIDKLSELSLNDQTMLIFLSDNGPAQYRYNGNLRGKKGQVYEGGIRVPAFINFGLFPPAEITVPAAHYDILPTLSELCDLDLQDNIDGIDLLNIDEVGRDRPIFIRESNYMEPYRDMMVRQGNFKLVATGGTTPVFNLFNLAEDPMERHDLSERFPNKVQDLKGQLDRWYEELLSSKNLRIQPITVGAAMENPVRLSRHELVTSYSSGWFSDHYLGYYLLHVHARGTYSIRLVFREPIMERGDVNIKIGPIGRRMSLSENPREEIVFENILLTPGEYVFQSWLQNDSKVISPFYVFIEKDR